MQFEFQIEAVYKLGLNSLKSVKKAQITYIVWFKMFLHINPTSDIHDLGLCWVDV